MMQVLMVATMVAAAAAYVPARPSGSSGSGCSGGPGCGSPVAAATATQSVSCSGAGCGGSAGCSGAGCARPPAGGGNYWWQGANSPFIQPSGHQPSGHQPPASRPCSGVGCGSPAQPSLVLTRPQVQVPSASSQAAVENLLIPAMGVCPISFVCVHWQLCRDSYVIADGTGQIEKPLKQIPLQVAVQYERCGEDMICCGVPSGQSFAFPGLPVSSPGRPSPSPGHPSSTLGLPKPSPGRPIPGLPSPSPGFLAPLQPLFPPVAPQPALPKPQTPSFKRPVPRPPTPAQPQFVPLPSPQPQPKPAPQPQPQPAPLPRPQPAPLPRPQPQPAPLPHPQPAPFPQPQPAPLPQPQPKPAPVPSFPQSRPQSANPQSGYGYPRPGGSGNIPASPQTSVLGQPSQSPQPTSVNQARPLPPTLGQPGRPVQPLARPRPQSSGPVSNPIGLFSPASPQPGMMGMGMMGMMPMRSGSCSAGTYCVLQTQCNPYNGFIMRGNTQVMAVWPDSPTVPLLPCFIPDGSLPAGVCCQEAHPNAGGFD